MRSFLLQPFAVSILGAVFQELMHWVELRATLGSPEAAARARSVGYWAITIVFAVASAWATLVWFDGRKVELRDYMITSAAFPLIVKKAIRGMGGDAGEPAQEKLGADGSLEAALTVSGRLLGEVRSYLGL